MALSSADFGDNRGGTISRRIRASRSGWFCVSPSGPLSAGGLSEQVCYRMRLDEIGWPGDERRFRLFADVLGRREGGVNPPPPDSAFLSRRKFERERLPIGVDHNVHYSARGWPRREREGQAVRFVAPIRLIKIDAVNFKVSLT